jgi:CIC family chloride channel protein
VALKVRGRGEDVLILWRLALPATIGVATGACVALASHLAEGQALSALQTLPGAVPALFSPLALLVTLAVSHFVTRAAAPATSEVYIEAYHELEPHIPLRQLPGRVLAGMTTVGFGGSQGLESPSALIGASWGDALGRWRWLGIPIDERRSLVAAGASAGIAAVFSSPAVGALYGIEIPFKRDVDAPRLVSCALAAACSYATRAWLIGTAHLVEVRGQPQLDATFVLACVAVAIGCGLGARLFAAATDLFRRHAQGRSRLSRAALAGCALALLAWAGFELTGTWITFGPGYVAAGWLTAAPHTYALLLLIFVIRTLGTLTCVYGGGGGGVFTSLACSGAFVGQAVAELVGRTETNVLPLLGAACFLASGYRLPIAGMLYVAEESGDMTVSVLGIVAIAIGQVLMGDASVSLAQRERR